MLLLTLSILSKTNAAAMPLLVLFFELSLGRGRLLDIQTWARVLPSATVVAGWAASRTLTAPTPSSLSA